MGVKFPAQMAGNFTLPWWFQFRRLPKRTSPHAQNHFVRLSLFRCIPRSHHHQWEWRLVLSLFSCNSGESSCRRKRIMDFKIEILQRMAHRERSSWEEMMWRKAREPGPRKRKMPGFLPAFAVLHLNNIKAPHRPIWASMSNECNMLWWFRRSRSLESVVRKRARGVCE